MRRLLEPFLPARLGSDFRWLIGSSWSTNLGDGIAFSAGPILEGDTELWGASSTTPLVPGTFVLMPADTEHGLRVLSEEAALAGDLAGGARRAHR